MPIPVRAQHRILVVAGVAVAAAWACAELLTEAERGLHARYARALAGPSRTQAALLVAIDEAALQGEDLRARLEPAIAAGSPRLVVWPAAAVSWPEGQVGDPGYTAEIGVGVGVDPLVGARVVRAGDAAFPNGVLAALGLPTRAQPLPARYVSQLPTVAATRVAAGEIPASTFRDRVVIVGRTDAAATTIATPLGPMSPAQVEAQALLGALDGALWAATPAWWLRLLALTGWALVLAQALRGRGVLGVLVIVAAAVVTAVAVDAGLFAAGLLRLGAGCAVVVAIVIGATRVLGLMAGALRADLLERTDTRGSASGLHKVSDA
jgi:hypothetical protein